MKKEKYNTETFLNTLSNAIKLQNPFLSLLKYDNCVSELTNIEKKILDFEEEIFDDWDYIEMNFDFKDKYDYFDYMISTSKYYKMMKIKSILETEIQNLYDFITSEAII